MGNREKSAQKAMPAQRRASAGATGSKAAKSFSSVAPVQKKDDTVQRNPDELDEPASLKADPAQLMDPEEELK